MTPGLRSGTIAPRGSADASSLWSHFHQRPVCDLVLCVFLSKDTLLRMYCLFPNEFKPTTCNSRLTPICSPGGTSLPSAFRTLASTSALPWGPLKQYSQQKKHKSIKNVALNRLRRGRAYSEGAETRRDEQVSDSESCHSAPDRAMNIGSGAIIHTFLQVNEFTKWESMSDEYVSTHTCTHTCMCEFLFKKST